jgi:hypothetical protein
MVLPVRLNTYNASILESYKQILLIEVMKTYFCELADKHKEYFADNGFCKLLQNKMFWISYFQFAEPFN